MTDISFNPWLSLPKVAPYILPEDREIIKELGNKSDGLRLDVLPDPYVGSPYSSRVVFLLLNPGFNQSDVDLNMKNKLYVDQTLANLQHKASLPFFYFHNELGFSGGNVWWSRILKPLLNSGFTKQHLGEHVMSIEYLPYHSKNYRHLGKALPSQKYTFQLVNDAIKANKTIVMMRGKKFWLEAVPELADYPYIEVKNPRNPVISIANLGQDNFESLRQRLR